MKKYKSIILIDRVETIQEDLDKLDKTLCEDANVFFILKNIYDQYGNIVFDVFDILNVFMDRGYYYKNIIVFPLKSKVETNTFIDNTGYILWVSNTNTNKYFSKDAIREKHIWKDVEWGRREKNYNPKGKDPGNVWIPTIDDGKGNITEHIHMSFEKVLERIIKMSTNGIEEYIVLGNANSILEDQKIIRKTNNSEFNENVKVTQSINHTVFVGSSENQSEIINKSLDFVITSPPYWDLKDYFKKGQIGQETYSKYLTRLKKVFSESYEKMNVNSSFWLNINLRRRNGKVNLNPKDIVNLLIDIGLNYKGIIIWHKSSGIPVNEDNLSDKFEYVFLFTKGTNPTFNVDYFKSITDYKCRSINGGSFWNINRKAGSVGKEYMHPAIYPIELVDRGIETVTNLNDYVSDPFLGSGTTLISSIKKRRVFIGYEYYEGFVDLIKSRIANETNGKNVVNFRYRQ